MTKNFGWKPHLKWLVPLVLIPVSFVTLILLGSEIVPEGGSTGRIETWIGLLLVLLGFVAPVVFAILTIVGAVKTYRLTARYAAKQKKKQDVQLQKASDRVFQSGGPKCDFGAKLVEQTLAVHWLEAIVRGEEIESGTSFNLNLHQGERIFRQFRAQYARFYGTNVTYQTGGTFAMGSPLFVAGAMLGSAIGNSNARANARRMAAEQWREIQYVDVFVTDRRFIIPLSGRVLSFYYDAVVAFYPELDAMMLTLDFGDKSEPLRLFSPAVSSASVMLVHRLQGVEGLRTNPALQSLQQDAILVDRPESTRSQE